MQLTPTLSQKHTTAMENASQYPTIVVPSDARIGDEPMGSKAKFWWSDGTQTPYLFKRSRPGTGEHWSEKVASELGRLLGVPCAHVDLATFEGEIGCVVRSFAKDGSSPLVHGNELLQELDHTYPVSRFRGVSTHAVSTVLATLESAQVPDDTSVNNSLRCGADWFVGYLMLDAVVLNTDRHHENWAVLQRLDGGRQLAPSYDHASSLGRELRDAARVARLAAKDPRNTVASYVKRARSALYTESSAAKPAHPTSAFACAARLRPDAAAYWLERLNVLTADRCAEILERVPPSAITEPARAFASAVIQEALRFTSEWMRNRDERANDGSTIDR